MSRDNDAALKTLMAEIQTLQHLLKKVDDGEMPMDVVTEQSQKIIDLLPVTPDAKSFPILELLMGRRRPREEIPSDVLLKLIESGFGSDNSSTCFYHAVNNGHYGAVRILVQSGVVPEDCLNTEYQWDKCWIEVWERIPGCAIVHLARKGDAPLDIFDLIATPQNLNHATPNDMYLYSLPLHSAVRMGHYDIALHLISLEADVNIPDVSGLLALEIYIEQASDYHDNIFTHLIPSNTLLLMDCFKTLAINCTDMGWYTNIWQPMIKRLMQYTKPVVIKSIRCVADDFNCEVVFEDQDPYKVHIADMYLFFIVVLNLDGRFILAQCYHRDAGLFDDRPAIAAKVNDLMRAHKSTVMSLQDLCIQYTRASMRDLSDESFSCLPVPPRLCRQLKLQDRADIVCAAYVYFLAKELSDVPVKLQEMGIELNEELPV